MICRGFRFWSELPLPLPGPARASLQRRLDAHAAGCSHCREFARRRDAVPALLRRAYEQQASAYVAPAPLRLPAPAHPVAGRPYRPLALAGTALLLAALAVMPALLRPSRRETARSHGAQSVTRVNPQPGTSNAAPPHRRLSGPGSQHTVRSNAPKDGGAEPQTPNAEDSTLNAQRSTPDAEPRTPDAERRTPNAERPLPDIRFLDGRDLRLTTWMLGDPADSEVMRLWRSRLPKVQDDFVLVPLPRLASADAKGAGEAIRRYEDEAKVVDGRLFHKVTLACKAMPLDEFCAQLTEQTGVKIRASRGVRDEKVTVFVEDRPARDVMREVARLFGYLFGRTGEPNAYRYELLQDLRSQLAEETMREEDVHKALLALDEEMSGFRRYLDQDVDALLARVGDAGEQDPTANPLYGLARLGGWGAAQLYFHLSPAERSALFSGKELHYTMDGPDGERHAPGVARALPPTPTPRPLKGPADGRLPAEWKEAALKTSGFVVYPSGAIVHKIDPNTPSTPIDQIPGAEPSVRLRMDRSEAGEISLWGGTQVHQGFQASGIAMWRLGKGRSPSTAKPENARENAALKKEPAFQVRIDLLPQPSCPRLAEDAARKKKNEQSDYQSLSEPELNVPHLNSADVWEEVHRRTHLPIVADAYTHLYPVSRLTFKQVTTFDALCGAGDAMGVRWRKDGDFLLARSTSFFWDKLKEVPTRLLRAWQADRERAGSLPLEDLLEMATLSDPQLGSHTVGLGIAHCWGLDEWGIVGGGPVINGIMMMSPEMMRKQMRALARLTPEQLAQARRPEGLLPRALNPRDGEAIAEDLNWAIHMPNPRRLHVEYIPRGWYVWHPTLTEERWEKEARRWPHVAARTREEALALARKYDPGATEQDIRWTRGQLNIVQITPEGEWIGTGGPQVRARLQYKVAP